VRKTFSPFRLVLCVVWALSLLGLQAYGQEREKEVEHPNGVVQDWSHRHVVYPRVGEIHALIAVQNEPRALLSWQAAARAGWRRGRGFPPTRGPEIGMERDWSISLGIGGTAKSMYPAKFTFDISAAASCPNDFIVYPVDVVGSATQPNLVAFSNLYSGTVPSNGICNRAVPPPGDNGTSATTKWSYNITAAGGRVSTSPALSLDGTKVAFVETAPATTAHFHVLAWKSGDGVDITTPNAQNVLKPVSITTGFATLAPAAGSGTVTDLALGSSSDTLSSPFVDYTNDLAYVGSDNGTLYRIKNVFCTLACTVGVTAAPSLDTSWGGTGSIATGCGGELTGPVVDGGTGNVLVGCSDGKLYGFTSAGVAITGSPLTVGNGTAHGGIVDPPLIDAVRGLVYVVSGASAGGTSVLVQAGTSSFSAPAPVTATLGAGGSFSLHAPSFNDGYFSSGVSSHWLIYEWALNAAGTGIELYGPTFTGTHTMNGGAPGNTLTVGGSVAVEFSPTTEFLNSGTGSDQFLVSGITGASPNFIEYNLNVFATLFPNSFPPSGVAGATSTQSGGTTGMIIDNASASVQASSIYFGDLGSNTAVKLTQAGLN
jgi:hypothetical protein